MLRDYEILFIVRPELEDAQLAESVQSVETLIGNLGGVTERSNVWGKRRLAYEVDHLREGTYVLTDFQLDPARISEMEATLKIHETVFRHLVVRKPDKVAPAAPPAQPAEAVQEGDPPAATEEAVVEPAEPEPVEANQTKGETEP